MFTKKKYPLLFFIDYLNKLEMPFLTWWSLWQNVCVTCYHLWCHIPKWNWWWVSWICQLNAVAISFLQSFISNIPFTIRDLRFKQADLLKYCMFDFNIFSKLQPNFIMVTKITKVLTMHTKIYNGVGYCNNSRNIFTSNILFPSSCALLSIYNDTY